jgi:hypothetical protein
MIMSVYRCDFDVETDLVLEPDSPLLTASAPSGHILQVWNQSADRHGHVPSIIISVTGEATSFEDASNEFRNILAAQLDVLSFVTHSRFRVTKTRRLVEWNDAQITRRFKVFSQLDARYPPHVGLNQPFLDSIAGFNVAPTYVRKALRNFRYALLEDSPDDQFVRMWLALEILAVNLADHEPPPIVCRSCGVEAKCITCGASPPPMQSSKLSIENLTKKIVGRQAEAVYKRLFSVRNGLMHGKSSDSVEAAAGVTWGKIIEVLGHLTWDAIILAAKLPGKLPGPFAEFAGDFRKTTLLAGVLGTFDHSDGGLHPAETRIPDPILEILTERTAKAPAPKGET